MRRARFFFVTPPSPPRRGRLPAPLPQCGRPGVKDGVIVSAPPREARTEHGFGWRGGRGSWGGESKTIGTVFGWRGLALSPRPQPIFLFSSPLPLPPSPPPMLTLARTAALAPPIAAAATLSHPARAMSTGACVGSRAGMAKEKQRERREGHGSGRPPRPLTPPLPLSPPPPPPTHTYIYMYGCTRT